MAGRGGRRALPPAGRLAWPLGMAALALVFWALFLGQAERSVFGRVPILDEVYFLDQARGPSFPAEGFFVTPLYPALIKLVGSGVDSPTIRVFGARELRGIRLFQIGCWAGVVLLLRLTAGRAFGRDLAPGWRRDLILWLPSLLFAAYRPAAVYAVSVLLELPLVFLVTLGVYLLTLGSSGRPREFLIPLGLGLVVGLAALLRGTALLLLLPATYWCFRPGEVSAGGWRRAVLMAAACAAVLAPAVLHNSRIAARPSGPTFNAGVNLFIGNGPDANGFYVAAVPGDWRRDPAGRDYLARRLNIQRPSLPQADRLWTREALAVVGDRPGRTAGLWLKKMWLHLQGWEIDQLTPLVRWRGAAPALSVLIVPYALLVVLTAAGVAGRWRRPVVLRWAGVIALLVAGQSVFFVVSRYRLALVPVLCLLAAVGVREILARNRPALIAALAAAIMTVPWGLAATRDMWTGQAAANEAVRWAEIGRAEDSDDARRTAERLYREALAAGPQGPAPWLGLAALLAERGASAEAAAILEEGLEAAVRNLEIQKSLLGLRLEAGDKERALDLTSRILADHPRDADTLHNRTVLLAERGETDAAVAVARRLIVAHPDDPRGYIDLGVILARSGRRAEARAVFEAGLEVLPDHPQLRRNLDLVTP